MPVSNILAILIISISAVFYCTEAACQTLNSCNYEGFVVDIGTTRDISCQRCSCIDVDLMKCCSLGHIVVSYPPECQVITDGCSERVVYTSHPDIECKDGVGLIGR